MHSGPRTPGPPPPVDGACNLFFGVFPPAATREAMAAQVARLRESFPLRGRWSDPSRFHITVQFLGRFSSGGAELLASPALVAMRAAAQHVAVPAFTLQLDTTGSFARGRVGWLGCTRPPAALQALWRQLGEALDAQGVSRDVAQAFVPHVTVVREARDGWPAQSIAPIAWPVSEFVLARSQPGRAGPYQALQAWPLH